jgi:hypothetical protein
MVHLLLLWDDAGDGSKRPKSQRSCDGIVRVNHHEDSFDELIDICDLFEMFFALLTNSQHPQSEKVRADSEEFREFQEIRVYDNRKRIFFEQLRESHNCFTLLSDVCRSQPLKMKF